MLLQFRRADPDHHAGSGQDQHPTQALLDIYTLVAASSRSRPAPTARWCFVGDLARGRTVRSLSYLLTNYPNVRQVFIAPNRSRSGEDVLANLRSRGVAHQCSDDSARPSGGGRHLHTRVQDEWTRRRGTVRASTSPASTSPGAVEVAPSARHPDASACRGGEEISTAVDRDPRAM